MTANPYQPPNTACKPEKVETKLSAGFDAARRTVFILIGVWLAVIVLIGAVGQIVAVISGSR